MAYSTLIIAEKRSAAKDIAHGLIGTGVRETGRALLGKLPTGEELAVTWAAGHMYELPEPSHYDPAFKAWDVALLPIVPRHWNFAQVPKKDQGAAIKAIHALVQGLPRDGELINACDAEREGELIYRKLIMPLRLPTALKMSRLWIHSFTVAGVKDAYAKRRPHSEYDPLGMSAQTRDEADWFLGINATRLATRTLGPDLLSVGRVQTPTLAMIVDRDTAIKHFVPTKYYEIFGEFPSGRAKFDVEPIYKSDKKVDFMGKPPPGTEDAKVFWRKDMVDRVAASLASAPYNPYTVRETTKREDNGPPLPFNLPEAQKKANASYGWSAAETLQRVQSLYEKKLVSYPRTNSRGFPEAERDVVYKALVDVWPVLNKFPLAKLGKLALPDAVTAARARAFDDKLVDDHYALRPTGETAGLDCLGKEEMLMFLLITHAVVVALDEAAQFSVTVRTYSSARNPYQFVAKGRVLIKEGWRRWSNAAPASPSDEPPLKPISSPTETIIRTDVVEKETKCPEHYTEGTLLAAMEHASRTLGDTSLSSPDAPTVAELAAAIKEKGIGTAATRHEIINKLLDKERAYVVKEKNKLIATDKGHNLIVELRKRSPILTAPLQTAEWEHRLEQMAKGAPGAMNRTQFLDALLHDFKAAIPRFPPELRRSGGGGSPPVPLTVLCPVSHKPVLDCGNYFTFPGHPDLRFYKTVAERTFTAEEYVFLIESWASGTPHKFDGFVSKKGTKFSAALVIDSTDPAKKRLSFAF